MMVHFHDRIGQSQFVSCKAHSNDQDALSRDLSRAGKPFVAFLVGFMFRLVFYETKVEDKYIYFKYKIFGDAFLI